MYFKLTQELMDNLIFAMENQHQMFVVDSDNLDIIAMDRLHNEDEPESEQEDTDIGPQPVRIFQTLENGNEEERYYPIPEWSSADGYQLMEKFVTTLHNPIFRQVLRDALTSGKGVFRNFKNALKSREDVERMWYVFKEKEMRERIIEWYERLCDAWEVEVVGPEPPETEELVLSDFVLKEGAGPFGARMIRNDYDAFYENLAEASRDFIEYVYQAERNGRSLYDNYGNVILRAETPAGDFAGFIWGMDEVLSAAGMDAGDADDQETESGQVVISKILQLYVAPEYRGLGLSKIILDTYLRDSWERGVSRIVLSLFGNAMQLSEKYVQLDFQPLSRLFDLDLEAWGKKNGLVE